VTAFILLLVLVVEIYLPVDRLVTYYGENLMGAHLPFNFQLLNTYRTAPHIAELIESYEAALPDGGWPNWVVSNHDRPRIAARIAFPWTALRDHEGHHS